VSTADVGRLGRTVVRLRPAQLGQRIRLRAQRAALDRRVPLAGRLLAGPDPGSGPGWPAGFRPLDARLRRDPRDVGMLRAGEAYLLGVRQAIAPPAGDGSASWTKADWTAADAPLLWRFHLYYWDWAWALAGPAADEGAGPGGRELFAAIWESWQATVPWGRGPAWRPYPAALRAWSFCGLYQHLAPAGRAKRAFRAELAALAGFLRRNLETDVGGNHLIKNLKALAGLAVFFGDDTLLTGTLSRLVRQLGVQVLPDGGHFERAPAYHCQVLGDLIDVARLLRSSGRPEPARLGSAITAMRGWLGAVLTPAGEVPLLNDGYAVEPSLLALLAVSPAPAGPLHLLPDTGLVRATAGGWHLLADVGPPCPRELPAHAHADTLGCLVHLDGRPLLVDTGTSTYAPGATRDHERSTAAHNTAEVDGQDSTEVWGAFRAGRRARVLDVAAGADGAGEAVTVQASHDGYRHLPGRPVHRRRWTVRAGELRVDDTVSGRGRHQVTVRWHLAPGTGLRLVPDGAVVTSAAGELDVTVTVDGEPATAPDGGTALTAATAPVSVGFGRTAAAPLLACTLTRELPVKISTVWRRAVPRQEPT
jgi:uncharacterized heparinase superfamily protein